MCVHNSFSRMFRAFRILTDFASDAALIREFPSTPPLPTHTQIRTPTHQLYKPMDHLDWQELPHILLHFSILRLLHPLLRPVNTLRSLDH